MIGPLSQQTDRETEIGLYIHVAFCRSICFYCDFNAYAGLSQLIPAYVDALVDEIGLLPPPLSDPWPLDPRFRVGSIYLGGGTPSLLAVEQIGRVLAAARQWPAAEDPEVSLEANPEDLTGDYLQALRDLGVNRLSIGVQTFDDALLRRLGRRHGGAAAIRAVEQARRAGFDNINLDLMFALPGQSLADWRRALDQAVALQPEHLSLYNLTIEEGTPFHRWVMTGRLRPPDDDLAADMYRLAIDRLAAAGYAQYEISNWARCDHRRCFQSRHNLRYWRNQPYLGVGAGAHSAFGGYRYANVRAPAAYIARIRARQSPVERASIEYIDQRRAMAETMFLGLRLVEGIAVADFQARFGCLPADVYGAELTELAAAGLLEVTDGRIRLTERGRFLGNEVFVRFVS
ncbi:MAG TPA: radical SAM family heme chaperone HemW [Chloroflexota bacterium]|nr:radical SAM family heme chaperone HemW [Chloroflexota bacterium]